MANKITGRKGGSSSSRTPTEQPDDLQSVAKAKILVALGEGEFAGQLTGKDIYLDGTALENADGSQNFSGVTWEFRAGTQAQKYIQGIPGTENEISVGTEVTSATAWTRTFTNTQLSAVRLRLKWPSLFKQEDDGDLVGYSVNYAIDLQTDGGTWQTVLNTSVTGKTTSGYERSHRIDLPQAGSTWTIRLRKITADANSAKIGDTMTLQSFTEVIDAKLRYPNTALLYIEFDSSQFNGSIPQISCEPRGRVIRVPDTYDPETRSYSGTWTGAFKWAWTDNPAWIFYDLVVSDRFGLGHRLTAANIDKWTLYQVAQYCDQMVPDGKGGDGTEPRYTCNVYIQDRNDAYTVLRDFAAIFRGMTYWGGDQIVALADMPRDVDYSYTRANVVGGRFTYSSSTTKTRYTTALVSWSDPGNAYADAMEPVFEQALVARYGFNQLEMTAIGCTRQSEANRKGRWGILTNNKDRVVSFDVGLDGNIPQPGYIIAVADELLSGKVMGGRISAVNGRVIKLDRVADAAAGDRLILNLPSGASQSRTIQAVNGESVTVTTAYSETPQAEAVWVVESNELYAQQYRVVSVADNDDGTFTITGAWHDPDKYARIDTGAIIDQRPVSVIPPGNQSPPANIVISSFSVVQQNISVETMRVSWDQAQNAIAYEAQWRRNDGNWVNVPRSSTTSFDVPGIYAGRYLVRVRAINAAEISSGWGYSEEKTLTGKVGNPPKPVGFIASDNVVFGIELNWGFPANTDDTLKTEIQYSLTGTEDDAMLLADVPYPQRKYQQMGLKAGQIFWYRAQLVDRSGNESGYTDFVRGQASIDVSDITDAILEEIKETDTFKDLIESAVESSEKFAELADAIKENANGLAAAVGSNKQTAETIIGNALAIADVVVRQTAQQGANSATFEQLREVIATETEARVTDVTRLEAKTEQNEAGITEVRQALSDEAQARATAVDQLTASTQVISDKADSASSKADAASGKADAAEQASSQNTADITTLRQVVTDTTSSMASRLEELGARTDTASGGIQNNAIALITSTLAQVDQQVRLSAQYGDSKASIDRIDNVMASDREATARSLLSLQTDVNGNKAAINSLNQTFSNYQQATATQINGITATINGHTSAITTNAQAIANVNGDLKAMYSIKVAVDANGKQYAAGMGIGVENTPSGMQSQVLFLADRFAVMTQAGGTVTLPFVIQGGQAFFNDAFFRNASIEFGKITDSLKSDNFVSGSAGTGWNLPKSGNAELNNVTIRGTVYATNGSFKGTVEATTFVGDIANVGIGSDVNISGGGVATKTITFTDSSSAALSKSALLEALIYVSSVTGTTTVSITLSINGNTRDLGTINVPAGNSGLWMTVRHAVKGITSATVTGVITVTGTGTASKIISSPTLTITRGTGSFA
ncbi:phage tail protein [Enterobacter hormaechei subsp. steigerwaltii]|uniref:phage tail protein n=15 Tax=Enterobacter TaxID=547 RepID=UPI001E3D6318|nr:phage tail protein [Enterobacter hormaechei]MCC9336964.1 phage tail protein [Enterobacter hormaechei subsp. steigerwaltii]MCC9378372.1 phage tail protein [Enterobacter hormaechei subsp. steigerwaltii]MCC9395122.1 phage tail protein [Enterobacter hormaechei subsp. steigerwaltii]MCC9416817.1 phage tail protein [Enterobacter hormaechei subsp. steigerwaltii]MCD0216709.1 phage tail protein [Enterobacter hormaechei subsp. steigerwaltii]